MARSLWKRKSLFHSHIHWDDAHIWWTEMIEERKKMKLPSYLSRVLFQLIEYELKLISTFGMETHSLEEVFFFFFCLLFEKHCNWDRDRDWLAIFKWMFFVCIFAFTALGISVCVMPTKSKKQWMRIPAAFKIATTTTTKYHRPIEHSNSRTKSAIIFYSFSIFNSGEWIKKKRQRNNK